MKFAKELEKTLNEEDVPEEWVEAAIKYKSLKKHINKVVSELEFLGLEHNTLKLILEDSSSSEVKEIDEGETTPNNPILAEYTLTEGENNQILPMLKLTLDFSNKNYTQAHIDEQILQIKERLEGLLEEKGINEESFEGGKRFVELKKDDDDAMVLSPTSSIPTRPSSPNEEGQVVTNENFNDNNENKNVHEIIIMLRSDVKFFQMLEAELKGLDQLKSAEEERLTMQVQSLKSLVELFSKPNQTKDLYAWRQLFKIYLDSEVYFKYNEPSSSAFARTNEQIKSNLEAFVDRVNSTGVLQSFKNKKGLIAYEKFLNLNYNLFKMLEYQNINMTALRKILKKFDKQTALGVKNQYPSLVSNNHEFMTGKSLAQLVCQVLQSSVVTLIPQVDDYVCPICCSIAFKPIRLECNHLFCVRCLVKMKQQNKNDCPFCRHKEAILHADGGNLDVKTMVLMEKYFPFEVKEKLKERKKEKYDEFVGNQKCILM